MQIMCSVIKQQCLLFAIVFLIGSAHAVPVANSKMLENYRESFSGAKYHIKYIFVDQNGENKGPMCCNSDVKKKIYLLDMTAKEFSNFIYSSEVNKLIKENFGIMIDNKSIISTPNTDYLVLTMSRPPEYNPKSTGCAVGMGEDRAYLISIANNRIKVLNRKFFDCAGSYRMVHDDERTGYEIRDYSKGADQPQSVLYLLQDGKLVRKENGPYKENP